jgi:hypothetical protein
VIRRGMLWMLATATLWCALGCSVLVDSGRVQCSTTDDCRARGKDFESAVCIASLCQPDPKWGCVGEQRPAAAGDGPFAAHFKIQDLLTMAPLPGIRGRLCRRLDVECSEAIGDEAVTNAAGNVTLLAPLGFDGYARFESDGTANLLYFFNPPVTSEQPEAQLSIGPPAVMTLLALQAGVEQEAERGVLLISARDCNGAIAPGVTLQANVKDTQATPFYSEQGLPSGSATQTDSAGYGGLLNARPGSITFSGIVAATGYVFGHVTLLAQPQTLTYGSVVPDGP